MQKPSWWPFGRDLELMSAAQPCDYFQFFYIPDKTGEYPCMDSSCTCGAAIQPGTGFLYVSQEVARVQHMKREREKEGEAVILADGLGAPLLVCEQAARRLRLDLEVAASDARRWWRESLVPIRPTPRR